MSNEGKCLSAFLKKARGTRSQADFARFLDVGSQQSYSRYERGDVPDGVTLLKIALKLGVTTEHLLTGWTSSPSPLEKAMQNQNIDFVRTGAELLVGLRDQPAPSPKILLADALAEIADLKEKVLSLERKLLQIKL